jgi:hypothetical protein
MDEMASLESRWRWSTSSSTIGRLRALADDLEAVALGRSEPHPTTLVTSWSFATRAAPCLVGNAFGHPSIGDGRRAITSEVYYVDPTRRLARTLSRWYRLGSYEPPDAGSNAVSAGRR